MVIALILLSTILLASTAFFYSKWKNALVDYKDKAVELLHLRERNKRGLFVSDSTLDISNVIRTHNSGVKPLCDAVLFRLAELLHSGHGCLWLYNEGEKHLELTSNFAGSKYTVGDKILPGETLAGEAFHEESPRVISDLPAKYVEINSGLGRGSALELLLIPLHFNGQHVGIIEFGSFEKFKEEHLSLADRISELFTGTIISAKAEERNQKQLEELQAQSAALSEKEAALEQVIEELKITQQAAEEARVYNEQRLEDQMKSQKSLMEKTVKRYEQSEQVLRDEIKKLRDELGTI